MLYLILATSVSLLITLFITPFLISIAIKRGIVDVPSSRKSHAEPTPLLGGVAISVATVISIFIFAKSLDSFTIPVLIMGALGVSLMGLIDDILSLSAKRRMIVLTIISIIVYLGSIQFYLNSKEIWGHGLYVHIILSIFIVIWMVGITNAINFSDGLDGLASNLSLISTISFAIIFSLQGRDMLVLPISLALMGAIMGFMPYNRNPAIVFMGDSGSMFIGFILSLLSITSIAYEITLYAIIVPVFVLLIPILDMLMSILRRLVLRRPIMNPDKMHFHHVLNQHINNHIFVVIILSGLQVISSTIGILIFYYKMYALGWVLMGVLISVTSTYTIINGARIRKIERSNTQELNK